MDPPVGLYDQGMFPGPSSNGQQDYDDKPHLTAIIHGEWFMVYRWPPQPVVTNPVTISFDAASKLESVLFGCRCRADIADRVAPVKVLKEGKVEVLACELVSGESLVNDALARVLCNCRNTPLGDKFVIVPINETCLLHFQRLPNVNYTLTTPNTCHLLYRKIPSSLEIRDMIQGLQISKREGDVTFTIKEE